jgi:hypothetical protein
MSDNSNVQIWAKLLDWKPVSVLHNQ